MDAFSVPSNRTRSEFYGTVRKLSATISLADGNTYEGGDLEFDLRYSNDGSAVIRRSDISRK